MKRIGLALLLVACGGSGDVDVDAGNGDGGGGQDVVSNDVVSSDVVSNDATSDGGGGDGSTFNPSSVSGLVLWLEGDLSSSITLSTPDAGPQKVTLWADQTSHKNDAKGLASSVSQGRNPSVKAAAINGLSAIHFDQGTGNSGNMLTITDNVDTSLQWGTGDFYVAVVGDFDNDPSKGQNLGVGNFFSKAPFSGQSASVSGVVLFGNVPSANTNPTAGMLFAAGTGAGNFVTTATAYNTGTAHLFAIRRQGTAIDLFVDGASVANATSGNVDVSGATVPIRLGADGDANLVRLDGDIGEILAVKGALSSSDQSGIESYLKSKWATP